ncbi:hypothetical protein OF83DRAFT_437264 [Amylostereum chailletii]|nr:hypothetical protein OF83DRAFT_437264 [Amylostereum chailletii]
MSAVAPGAQRLWAGYESRQERINEINSLGLSAHQAEVILDRFKRADTDLRRSERTGAEQLVTVTRLENQAARNTQQFQHVMEIVDEKNDSIRQKTLTIEDQHASIVNKDRMIAQHFASLLAKDSIIAELQASVATSGTTIGGHQATIAELQAAIADRNEIIQQMTEASKQKDVQSDSDTARYLAMIQRLQEELEAARRQLPMDGPVQTVLDPAVEHPTNGFVPPAANAPPGQLRNLDHEPMVANAPNMIVNNELVPAGPPEAIMGGDEDGLSADIVPRCTQCAWEVVEGFCQYCGLEHAYIIDEDEDDDHIIHRSISTDHEILRSERQTAPRGTTPVLDVQYQQIPTIYGERRLKEYIALLARGATKLMCETFMLEYTHEGGIIAYADADIFAEFSGSGMRECDRWKICLGRVLILDENDLDGSRFLEELLEEACVFPLVLGDQGAGRWETVLEQPGVWITRPVPPPPPAAAAATGAGGAGDDQGAHVTQEEQAEPLIVNEYENSDADDEGEDEGEGEGEGNGEVDSMDVDGDWDPGHDIADMGHREGSRAADYSSLDIKRESMDLTLEEATSGRTTGGLDTAEDQTRVEDDDDPMDHTDDEFSSEEVLSGDEEVVSCLTSNIIETGRARATRSSRA